MRSGKISNYQLNLVCNEEVEVLSKEEILETLDSQGKLDNLPFMPEMFKFCGKRFRVHKRADKTCDTIENYKSRRMNNAVHLENITCDGEFHGGCGATCSIFWKEAWLKRVKDEKEKIQVPDHREFTPYYSQHERQNFISICTEKDVIKHARKLDVKSQGDEEFYSCQATELRRATAPMEWWDIRQYYRDIRSGNVKFTYFVKIIFNRLFHKIISFGVGYRILIRIYNFLQKILRGVPYPYASGKLKKTPHEVLNLKPGELIRVKSHQQILETLNERNRNRGLSFDVEMVRYCGGTYRVLKRVDKIIEEKTGQLLKLPNDCVILDGVFCCAEFSEDRLFCPRELPPFWREIWLERV